MFYTLIKHGFSTNQSALGPIHVLKSDKTWVKFLTNQSARGILSIL